MIACGGSRGVLSSLGDQRSLANMLYVLTRFKLQEAEI
jgi:hypothetical protein